MRPVRAFGPPRLLARFAVASGVAVALLGGCSTRPPSPEAVAYVRTLDRAEAALAVGEFDAALALFDEVTRLAPAEIRGWEGLALSHVARGEDAAALQAFRGLAARIDAPMRPELLRARCGAALRQVEGPLSVSRSRVALLRLEDEGLRACSEAQRLALAIRVHLAVAAASADAAESERHYSRVLELEPGHEAASLELAARRMSLGRPDDAIRMLSAALEEHPRSRALVEAMVEALTVRPRAAAQLRR